MAQAARRPAPARTGGGYGTLIFFVVLSILLMVGYVFMYLALDKRAVALESLQSTIEAKLESPLRRDKVSLPVQSVAGSNLIKYGPEFFAEVYELARKGIAYADLVPLVGWPADTAVEDIRNRLKATSPPKINLAELIRDQENTVNELRLQLRNLESQLAEVRRDRDAAIAARDAARKKFDADYKQALADLKTKQDEWEKQRKVYMQSVDAANAARDAAWAAQKKAAEEYKQAEKGLQEKIKQLGDRVQELEALLRGPKKEEVTGPVATTTRVDHINGFLIIDRGSADNLKNGDQLLIYRAERGGRKAKKGEAVIVQADSLTSRADITLQRELDPIAAGDLVYLASAPPPASEVIASAEELKEETKAMPGAVTPVFREQRRSSYIRLR